MAQVLTTASGKQVPIGTPGVAGFASEKLLPSGQGTATGDVFNQFRGYAGPQGGTFGGGPSADPAAARRAWESVSGVSGDKLGDTSGWDAGRWDAARKTFGGIANNDKNATMGALSADNPFMRETAQRYADQNGWGEQAVPTPGKNIPVAPGGVDLSAAPPSDPNANLDLYGRTDAATSNRPVMKSSDTFASLQDQARRMATPQLAVPSATIPPADPFQQFNQQALAGAPGALPGALGVPQAPTFQATNAPSTETAVPGGGIISDPAGGDPGPTTEPPVLGGGIITDPVGGDPGPNLASSFAAGGGFGGAPGAVGPVASGGGLGSGLRKLGGMRRNPLIPESRQNSGLFSGLKKLGQPKRGPTGTPAPMGGAGPAAY